MATHGGYAHRTGPRATGLGRWRHAGGLATRTGWASEGSNERCWGIEGSGHYGRGLAQFLVAQGEVVKEVNTRLTVLGRRRRGSLHKNDHQDALAIAAVVREQGAQLPQIQAEDSSALLALLTRERDDLQAAATRLRNPRYRFIQQAEPGATKARLLRSADLEAWRTYQTSQSAPLKERVRARRIRQRAQRLASLLAEIVELEQQIAAGAPAVAAPLTEIVGVGMLTAGMLAGYLGPGTRFASERQLAAYAGVAPLEVSSGWTDAASSESQRPPATQRHRPSHRLESVAVR